MRRKKIAKPSRAQSLLDTQKSLSERYLITFRFSRNFWSEKLFAENFGTREARKIEPWYELLFQNVYWEWTKGSSTYDVTVKINSLTIFFFDFEFE
jgi:hypothetical protein